MQTTKAKPITTTIGDLTAAYFEAAFAELKDAGLAQRIAEVMVRDRLSRRPR